VITKTVKTHENKTTVWVQCFHDTKNSKPSRFKHTNSKYIKLLLDFIIIFCYSPTNPTHISSSLNHVYFPLTFIMTTFTVLHLVKIDLLMLFYQSLSHLPNERFLSTLEYVIRSWNRIVKNCHNTTNKYFFTHFKLL
jgi:hypothetical protein